MKTQSAAPAGRNNGRFTAGNPGRPKGARNKATIAAQSLLEGEAEALTRKAVDMALAGDIDALKLCLARIAPPRREAPVTFDLPELVSSEAAADAARAVLEAVATGELAPSEAATVLTIVDGWAEAQRQVERRQEAGKLFGNWPMPE